MRVISPTLSNSTLWFFFLPEKHRINPSCDDWGEQRLPEGSEQMCRLSEKL